MSIRIVNADGAAEYAALAQTEARRGERGRETEEAVRDILRDVRANGDAALRAYGLRFDGGLPESIELSNNLNALRASNRTSRFEQTASVPRLYRRRVTATVTGGCNPPLTPMPCGFAGKPVKPARQLSNNLSALRASNRTSRFEYGREAFAAALEAASPAFRGALERAAANIRRYHERQICEGYEIKEAGVTLGQTVRGLARVGLYVPGGTAAYPSSVLMNGIPAKLAGVSELIVVTPPARTRAGDNIRFEANADILAAACVAGVDRLFLTGGAQAVAALAYGTESIPRVDKIVGPGNVYVATAKRLLYGEVDIDMIAGPSEILVLADAGASPAYIAADLLSQAEHDRNAAAILLTTSAEVAAATADELERRLRGLERGEIARASIESFGLIIVCAHADEMFALADRIAPEHLEILLEDPLSHLKRVKNAGSVFCGPYAPEALGDYYAGTNHVLPTAGAARFASPLGVYDFVKRMSYTHYTREALEAARDDIVTIAEREGLGAHADAIKARFSPS